MLKSVPGAIDDAPLTSLKIEISTPRIVEPAAPAARKIQHTRSPRGS